MPESVENLRIWQESMDLAVLVYGLTRRWPESERFGLINQARRAAYSIPANLAEGIGRGTKGEAARYARMALGSAYELHTLLELARRLRFPEPREELAPKLQSLIRQISSFIAYQEAK